jgi:hypothetical protein
MSKMVWTVYGCVLSLVLTSSLSPVRAAEPPKAAARPPVASASGASAAKPVCALYACVSSSIALGPGHPGWYDALARIRFQGSELTIGSRKLLAATARQAHTAKDKGETSNVEIRLKAEPGLSGAAADALLKARATALRQPLDAAGLNDVRVSY